MTDKKDNNTSGPDVKKSAAPDVPETENAKTGQDDKKSGGDAKSREAHTDRKSGEDAKNREAQTDKNGGNDKSADAGKAKKELSENEVLKLYLQQTMKELDRVRGELDAVKKQTDSDKQQLEAAQKRLKDMSDEYENYRRRTAVEKENIMSDAVAKAVGALLPALDSLEQAVGCAHGDSENFGKGVEMTLKQLLEGFDKLGVTEIKAEGAQFDPKLHNAVMHVDDDSLGASVVAQVFQKGYAIGDKVIRHSVVKVAN